MPDLRLHCITQRVEYRLRVIHSPRHADCMTVLQKTTPPAHTPADSPGACVRVRARGWTRQLVLLPLALVSLAVLLGLGVVWWSQADYDALALVRDLRAARGYDWPRAYALSQLLRSPAHDSLKDDASLCRELTALLALELRRTDAGPDHVQFQAFLCRVLAEFRLPHGIPVLLDAVEAGRAPRGVPVRIAALEALAVVAGQLESPALSQDPRALALLLECTQLADATATDDAAVRVAATATFALGVVGGPVAVARLRNLLTDAHADLRYNAATGLARHGVTDSIPVLVAMLEDASDAHGYTTLGQVAHAAHGQRIRTAARAAQQLARASADADLQSVLDALDRVARDASTPPDVREEVVAAQRALQARGFDRHRSGSL
jgi:hypothetical protein